MTSTAAAWRLQTKQSFYLLTHFQLDSLSAFEFTVQFLEARLQMQVRSLSG